MAALHHSVAAVVSPLTDLSSFMITPAPKKPIPATTWAATLVISDFGKAKENLTNRKEPKLTKIIVLRPTFLLLYCLSTPMHALSKKQAIIWNKKLI